MRSEMRKTFWFDHIEGWKESGESQKDYCRANSLSLPTFGYWRRKLSGGPADAVHQHLVEVGRPDPVHEPIHGEALIIRIWEGIEIMVTVRTDLELLKRVLDLVTVDTSRC